MKMNENLRGGEWIIKKTVGVKYPTLALPCIRVKLPEWRELARMGS